MRGRDRARSPGVADLGIVKAAEQPAIAVTPNRDALARYDLDLGDVQDYIETALAGHAATELWDGEKRFDVTVRLPRRARARSVEAIRNLRVPLKDGALVPVARARRRRRSALGRAAITRENGKRYVGIRMNVRNRDLGSFVAEAQQQASARGVKLPAGYELVWGGEFENQQRAMKRLTLVVAAGAPAHVPAPVLGVRHGVGRDDHPAQRAVRAARRRARARRSSA